MADDVTIIDGLGAQQVIGTDQVAETTLGTVQVQFTKLMDGTLGGTNKLVINMAGAGSVEDVANRRLLESQFLQTLASQMAALDPARGYEIR